MEAVRLLVRMHVFVPILFIQLSDLLFVMFDKLLNLRLVLILYCFEVDE